MPAGYRQNSRSAETTIHPVTRADVARAKVLMRGGTTLHEAAKALDVLASDLDRNLFQWLGAKPEAMTVPVRRFA